MAAGQSGADGSGTEPGTSATMKRRGILAAAAAAVAGIVAKQAAEPVAANNGGPLLLGNSGNAFDPNFAEDATEVRYNGAVSNVEGVVFLAQAPSSFGYFSPTDASYPAALAGWTGGSSGFPNGIYGFSSAAGGPANANSSGNGVVGSAVGGGNGVYGIAYAAATAQVNAGVYGDSSSTYGIIGRTTAAGYSGLTGITSTPGVAAMACSATVSTAYAAYFTGKTVVQGDFYVLSGGKFAAVPLNGTYRGMYATEAPEPWFEDFGEAKLVNGKAEVTIDPEFAALIHTGDYHVFLTAHTDQHLHVAERTAGSFTVAADTALAAVKGTAISALNGTFSYRVVAKRKDIAGERLPTVDLPKINIPDVAKLPKQPNGKHP